MKQLKKAIRWLFMLILGRYTRWKWSADWRYIWNMVPCVMSSSSENGLSIFLFLFLFYFVILIFEKNTTGDGWFGIFNAVLFLDMVRESRQLQAMFMHYDQAQNFGLDHWQEELRFCTLQIVLWSWCYWMLNQDRLVQLFTLFVCKCRFLFAYVCCV